jgi:hypothetical protein
MPILIDPIARRLVLDTTSVTTQEVYVAWVDWVSLDDHLKYPPAFRSVGGDDLGGGLSIPPYFFLTNDWRIRPLEGDHTLTVDGNLFVDGGVGVPIVQTLGSFGVLTRLVVAVQAQGINLAGSTGPTATEIATAVRLQLSSELSRLDAPVSSRATIADIFAAVG